jgi:phosphoserine phosphatase RsbU/P
MHKSGLFALVLALPVALLAPAMLAAQTLPANPAEITPWESGLIELNQGWVEHDGDNLAWANPGYDDSAWQAVDLEDMGPAQPGWRWFRKHVNVGPDHKNVHFLVDGGDGAYELYANGQCMLGAQIKSQFAIGRPVEREFELSNDRGDFYLALRTRATPDYAAYQLPLFIAVTLGDHDAIEYELQSLESDRMDSAVPSVAINLLLILAGLGVLALYAGQRSQRDYLFLGLFLVLTGVSNLLWHLQQAGVLPLWANTLVADPLIYFIAIAQLEFTLSFVRRRAGRGWRTYEAVILSPLLLVLPVWLGRFSVNAYDLLQTAVTLPLAFLLPALLIAWYRRGNREAGWLIFPSLLPTAAGVLFNLGLFSIYLGWARFSVFLQPIPIGPVSLETSDVGNLLFLLAIAIVMFFRFARVSREQARVNAELEAARAVQQRLVPPALQVPGFRIESAYLPAEHVGGDFLHLRPCAAGGVIAVLGDVSGKGLPAALSVAAIVGALRAFPELAPAETLRALNRSLRGELAGGFVTCCSLRLARDGTLTLANAGHLPPYLNGREIDSAPALPLGLIPDAEYPELRLRLDPGAQLTLLSDGVVEARNPAGELLGFDRAAAISTQTAESIARAAQIYGQEDDITVLTLTLAPAAEFAPNPPAQAATAPAS